MALDLYFRLSQKSKAAMGKTTGRFGRRYIYRPRFPLLDRLSRETGMTMGEVALKLMEERQELLQIYKSYESQS